MKIEFIPELPHDTECHALLIPTDGLSTVLADHPGRGDLIAAAEAQRFNGEVATLIDQMISVEGARPRRTLLVGIGAGQAGDLERGGAALSAHLLTSTARRVCVDARGHSADGVARLAGGGRLRAWRFDDYHTRIPENRKIMLDEVAIISDATDIADHWRRVESAIDGVRFARQLVTLPANILYPETFVERCRILESLGVEIEVLDEAAMARAGMGALLGVAQGSFQPPRLLVMRWCGEGAADETPTVFIGKGVTFDTGGICLKPAAGMEDMKWDMGGAAAVAGAMQAIAGRKARAHIVGICGLVENMPDGKAQRPGDVVKSMSGQTVEVINTDAEGRLVLCDAITWAQKRFNPKTIVDLATLTGAMIISLGHEYAGLFANDDVLADQLLAAGKASGDPLWRMPMGEAYDKLIDSPIADVKNVGPREGGSITAAQFLQRFVDDGVRWAHLDIAGMVWAAKPASLWDKGATGFGVRLLDRFVADHCEV